MKSTHQTDKKVWIGFAHIIEDLSGQFRTCQLIARRNHDNKTIVEIHPTPHCPKPKFVVDMIDDIGIIHTTSSSKVVAQSSLRKDDHFQPTDWGQKFMMACLG